MPTKYYLDISSREGLRCSIHFPSLASFFSVFSDAVSLKTANVLACYSAQSNIVYNKEFLKFICKRIALCIEDIAKSL